MKKAVLINLDEESIRYFKNHKMNTSSFVRQARRAHQQGKFEYDFL